MSISPIQNTVWDRVTEENDLRFAYECGRCFFCENMVPGKWICEYLPPYITRSKWQKFIKSTQLTDEEMKSLLNRLQGCSYVALM